MMKIDLSYLTRSILRCIDNPCPSQLALEYRVTGLSESDLLWYIAHALTRDEYSSWYSSFVMNLAIVNKVKGSDEDTN